VSALQKPDATHVAGFRTWDSLGRFVNKGERGILILAPMIWRTREQHKLLPEGAPAPKDPMLGFRAAYVFDISQTGGKDLPVLTEVRGDVTGLRERLTGWLAGQSIAVCYCADIAPAQGVSSGGKITLLPGLPSAEEFATLVHEVAHLCGAEIYVAPGPGMQMKTHCHVQEAHITRLEVVERTSRQCWYCGLATIVS
jgi:hypothetical protein